MNRGYIMTEEERAELIEWTKTMIPKMRILDNNRTDFSMEPDNKDIHPLVWEIKKRIIEKEKIETLEKHEEPIFKDFLAIIHKGGHIHRHRDPNKGELYHCRFNVFVQLPEKGGQTYYNDVPIQSVEGCYVLCFSGLEYHWSTIVESEKGRFSLSFGFLLPAQVIQHLQLKRPMGGKLKKWISRG
uniref:Prolyl 4-hydroxylase alpha subunit Fe(2+) 2OG dioxygenase domain-containing protein n=1 Tax=viral metagenome TaxID=1070528 RepID=A0A6C0BK63_9ZZZZ